MATVTLTGIDTLDGTYVQGWSKVKIDLSGESIPSDWHIVFYYDQKLLFDSGWLSNVTTYTSPVFEVSGRVAAVAYGLPSNTQLGSGQFTIQPYSRQTITEILPERPIEDEQTVIVSVAGTISPLGNKNDKKVLIVLQNEAGDNLAQETIVPDSYNFTVSTTFKGITAEESLICLVCVQDSFETVAKEAIVPTSSVTMDFHYSGTGVAFGKVAEASNLLDIAWDVRIKGDNLIDYIIERETDGIWTVEKYASGKVEAYGSVSLKTTVTTGIGSIYYTGSTLTAYLPTCFLATENPVITATVQSTGGTAVNVHIGNYITNERKILYLITSPFTQNTSTTYLTHFRVVGKWK